MHFSHTSTFQLLDNKPWSQVSSLLPPGSCLQFLSRIGFSNPTARRFSIECLLLTHALALSASLFVHKKKSQRIYTSSMHSAGLELTNLTYTRLEDNRGDRCISMIAQVFFFVSFMYIPQGAGVCCLRKSRSAAAAVAAAAVATAAAAATTTTAVSVHCSGIVCCGTVAVHTRCILLLL